MDRRFLLGMVGGLGFFGLWPFWAAHAEIIPAYARYFKLQAAASGENISTSDPSSVRTPSLSASFFGGLPFGFENRFEVGGRFGRIRLKGPYRLEYFQGLANVIFDYPMPFRAWPYLKLGGGIDLPYWVGSSRRSPMKHRYFWQIGVGFSVFLTPRTSLEMGLTQYTFFRPLSDNGDLTKQTYESFWLKGGRRLDVGFLWRF